MDCTDNFFDNCGHPDGFIDVVAFDNTHFLIVPVVVPAAQSAWVLIGEDGDFGLL